MVRKYKRTVGSRPYANFSQENLAKALADIRKGVSQAEASRRHNISRSTLRNKLFGKYQGDPGHPTTLSPEDEQAITNALTQVANWGFPLTSHDVAQLVAKYVQKQGRTVKEWKNNHPGPDFVANFVTSNNLSSRLATNIKKSRSSVGHEDISEFFNNIQDVLKDADPHHVFNYDETNISDDPGAKKVLVPRGTKRIERVQEHSRAAVSIMVCGSSAGILLPPMVVYKALNLYENWTTGGPPGTIYNHSSSGWFDMNLFEQWFFKVLLPHVQNMKSDKVKIVIGDNLASHFSPAVIKASQENNIYMTPLPPNSTHIMQPLDVSVFAPMKRKWRQILDDWRKTSRSKGTIPKEQFPLLLNRLWTGISPTVDTNLKSGFRTTGIHPFDPQVVLSKLPTTSAANTSEANAPTPSVLSDSVLEYLQEARGSGAKTPNKKRGKKIAPGMRMMDNTQSTSDVPASSSRSSTTDIQPQQMDFPSLETSLGSTSKKGKAKAPKRKKKPSKSSENSSHDQEDSICNICAAEWEGYRGADWIRCILCKKWVCGVCNKGSTNTQYMCEECEDDD